MFLLFGWIGTFTLLGILAQILLLRACGRQTCGRRTCGQRSAMSGDEGAKPAARPQAGREAADPRRTCGQRSAMSGEREAQPTERPGFVQARTSEAAGRPSRRPSWVVPAVLAALGLLRAALLCVLTADELAGHTFPENTVTFLAHLFLGCIPVLGALAVWGFFRPGRRWTGALLTAALLLVFPFHIGIFNDGGSRQYGALLYDITFLHQLPTQEGAPYVTGTRIRPLHLGDSGL